MNYVFHMLNRVTGWTQNHKICNRVIMSIAINMMYTYYFFMFIISTQLTFLKKTSSNHVFSNRTKNSFPCRFAFFIYTKLATIFSFYTWRVIKYFIAVFASMFDFVVINSLFTSYCFQPMLFSLIFCYKPKACSRATNSSILSVWLNLKDFTTMFAYQGDHNALKAR